MTNEIIDDSFDVEPEVAAHSTVKRCQHLKDGQRQEAAKCRKCKDAKRQRANRKQLKEQQDADTATLNTKTVEDFWALSRQQLAPDVLEELTAKHELVLDQLHWIKYGANVNPTDQDFVSLEEGVADLVDFVVKNPCPRLHHYFRTDDVSLNCWQTKFWANASLMKTLSEENAATETYVKYGLLTGIPDFQVHQFLEEKAGWSFAEIAALVGYVVKPNGCIGYPGTMRPPMVPKVIVRPIVSPTTTARAQKQVFVRCIKCNAMSHTMTERLAAQYTPANPFMCNACGLKKAECVAARDQIVYSPTVHDQWGRPKFDEEQQ